MTFARDRVTRVWQEQENGSWSATALPQDPADSLYVMSATVLRDGRLVTGSYGQVRVWQEQDGGQWNATVLELGQRWAARAKALPDGGFVVGSHDGTGWVWQPQDGGQWISRQLGGVADWGHDLFAKPMPGGGFFTGAWHTGQVWAQQGGQWKPTALRIDDGGPEECSTILPDGRPVTVAADGSTQFWGEGGEGLTTRWSREALSWWHFKGTVLPDAGIVTGARDPTTRLWRRQAAQWSCTALEGHAGFVSDVIGLSDGRLATVSYDRTARVWAPPRETGEA